MPFDNMDFTAAKMTDTSLVPIWARYGRHLLLGTHCRRERAVTLRAPFPSDHDAAVVQLPRDAKTLIEDPQNWAQRRYHRFGGRHCAVGALRAVSKGRSDPEIEWSAHDLLNAVARSRGFSSAEEMNDRSSHAEVLDAFDSAIAAVHGAAPE